MPLHLSFFVSVAFAYSNRDEFGLQATIYSITSSKLASLQGPSRLIIYSEGPQLRPLLLYSRQSTILADRVLG